jgi:alkylation response protein AidB-like acyl-CoA dehydrogenase
MNLELTDEQAALRDTVRHYLAEKASVTTHVRLMLDDQTGTTAEVWRGLSALGATGVLVPQEFGGSGMTMVEAGVVAEELGAALHPGPWLSSAVAATRALTRTGADAGPLFTGIADGSTIATVGQLTGPRPLVENGTMSGMIDALPDAVAADVVLVLADEGGRTGLFAVDARSDDVDAVKRTHVDPTQKLFDVTLAGVPARWLAFPSEADVQGLIDDVLIAHAADALGAATAVMNLAVEYAKVRRQFEQPIGSFQAVQHLCVDMFEIVELARSGVLHALWAADAAPPGERHLAAVRAKAYAGQLATVADNAIQVFGGIGYTWEHDAHLYLKRLLGWNAFLGGSDKYLQEVGRALL